MPLMFVVVGEMAINDSGSIWLLIYTLGLLIGKFGDYFTPASRINQAEFESTINRIVCVKTPHQYKCFVLANRAILAYICFPYSLQDSV